MEFLNIFEDFRHYLFAVITACIATIILLYVNRTIAKASDKQFSVLKRTKRMDALHTDLLSKRAKAKQKEEIAERIDQRFSVIKRSIMAIIVILAIIIGSVPFLGKLPTTFISLLLTGFTVVLGIAARPFVENMISGIVISMSNQIRIGDTLYLDKQYGTVEDVQITHTRIKTWDWKRYLIPNSRMLTKEFINLTLLDRKLWAYMEFYVSYDADIEKVEKISCECAHKSEYFSDVDEPQFWVIRMEEDSVVCWIAAWAESPSRAWALKSDIAKNMLIEFKKQGIRTNITNIELTEELPKTSVKPKKTAKKKD
jgi:small-conductance mechanosensitive channel